MSEIGKHPARDLGYSLLGPDYLPIGEAELALRDEDVAEPQPWRELKSGEIEILQQQGNLSPDWGSVHVAEPFHASAIQRCRFFGLVRIGGMGNLVLSADGARLPVGLTDSTLVCCDIGPNCVIDRVGYLAHAIVGREAVVQGIGRLLTTPRAVFGNGVIAGDEEGERTWIEVGNEAGGRAVLAFDTMLPADAWLWSRRRGDPRLGRRLSELTDELIDRRAGHYSTIGAGALVRDARTLVDVRIGEAAAIHGADRLENVTIRSNAEEPTTVEEGTTAVDGIVGPGCRLGPRSNLRRFVLGQCVGVLDGARVAHSVVGDNSTVEGCEIRNALLLPHHEQHHNNSFLIAVTLEGQSNIAAGVTLGSNHNSRAPDGEVLAGRGFWPGLCADFKHNCRFAAYTLVVKGSYPAEIDQPLPFSLVSRDGEGLRVAPAWWLLHNMYAVQRNAWKFRARDRRRHPRQHIVSEPLAPDTIEAILVALERLERWTGETLMGEEPLGEGNPAHEAVQARGRELLTGDPDAADALAIEVAGIENSRRPTRILKAGRAYAIYREIAHHYAVTTVIEFMEHRGLANLDALRPMLRGRRERRWLNLGGQLIGADDADRLIEAIVSGRIDTWQAVHAEYDRLWQDYEEARAVHAGAVALALGGLTPDGLDEPAWRDWLERAAATQDRILELAERTRAKDAAHPFRAITFAGAEEMEAVLGRVEDDPLVRQLRERTEAYRRRVGSFAP